MKSTNPHPVPRGVPVKMPCRFLHPKRPYTGLNTQRDYPLSVAIAQSDYRDWRIFPLECIAGAYDTFDAFKAVARPRELFWMRRLHTFLPQGLNQDCPRSTHYHCKRAHNPIYKRSPPLVHFPALPSAPSHLEAHIVAPFAPLPPLDLDHVLNMEDDSGYGD